MGKVFWIAACMVALLATDVPAQGPPPPPPPPAVPRPPAPPQWKNLEEMLRKNVDNLVANQKPDGSWDYNTYPHGMTALAGLALKLSNDPRGATAVAKAVQFLVQAQPEYKTYSAGMIISLLYQVNPRTHESLIDKYASLLVKSQNTGETAGMYGYDLVGAAKPSMRAGWGDNSNTQFAVLGLLFAERAGYQVPRSTWEALRNHYTKTQRMDGGWSYQKGDSSQTMTLAGTVSLYIAEEQLAAGANTGCVMTPPSRATEAAMKWVATNFTTKLTAYGLYAMERLGILTGRSEFGGHYWFEEGAKKLLDEGITSGGPGGGGDTDTAFLILFLSRGKEPIVINKLKYYGDWDNAHYDVKHMTDYISDRMQNPVQWRVVTLDSELKELLKVPILHYNGIKGPAFNDNEKIKLREYVMQGGVLMAQACNCTGGAKEFDEGFRALMEECFPEGRLEPLPAQHPIYETPRKLTTLPKIEVMKFKDRIGVIYVPKALTLDWHRGGVGAKNSLDTGTNIVFFVLKQAGKLGATAKPTHDAPAPR